MASAASAMLGRQALDPVVGLDHLRCLRHPECQLPNLLELVPRAGQLVVEERRADQVGVGVLTVPGGP